MTRRLRLLAVWLVAALSLTACDFSVYSLPLPGGADLGDDSYAVDVQFRDVLDLVPQSAVKVDEVTVGKVEEVSLQGYTALVTLRVNGDVRLPENAFASIRQTSLLGEKFVALTPPSDEAPTGRLSDGDTIPLSRSGRNPEVEEVLGALSLLLNGGGVAQLKTISQELNKALTGNEAHIRSVLDQLDEFMGQLDKHKAEIVRAIRSVNQLTISVKQQRDTIVRTLDRLPQALKVLNQQRDGLVKMLHGLKRLSPVAIRVIRASKQDTLANLRALDPILTKLAEAGAAVPKSFQVLLTYPFVDAVIGTSPAEAQNLHMGDYTNLSAQLDIDLNNLPTVDLPTPDIPDPCELTPDLPQCDEIVNCVTNPSLPRCQDVVEPLCERLPDSPRCQDVVNNICERLPRSKGCEDLARDVCQRLPDSERCQGLVDTVCQVSSPLDLCPDDNGGPTPGGGGGGGDGGGDGSDSPVCNLPVDLCRPGFADRRRGHGNDAYDRDLALLLLQGVQQ